MSDEGRLIAGRYRLAEHIGRGGMGTVWRAADEVLGRQVALKRLHAQPHLSADELATLYERTRREGRSAARITHPNVVVVHDVVDDGGRPCIVMEYVPAPTLGELLKRGRTAPPEEAARIGLGMVAALRAAHAAGVLHRDVKPGNVLLGSGDRVVLTDFGIATTAGTSTLTKTGEMVGSIDYMAPERIRGRKPGPASDLWALGATLYQAVEGRPPFRRDTAVETAYAIAVDPPEPMRQAGALAPLIEALLVKDPDERPSAEQTERALWDTRSGRTTAVLSSAPAAGSAAEREAAAREAPDREATGREVPERESAHRETVNSKDVSPAPGPRRTRKRRVLVSTAVALTAAATAVAGTLYATSHHDTDTSSTSSAPKGHRADPPSDAPSPVPQGYHLVKEKKLGISFPVPDGWKVDKRTADTVIYTNENGRVGITIGIVEPAGANPMPHFTDIEANTKVNYPTYRKLRMQQTTFRSRPAAIWEFTFKGRERGYRAIDLGFGREGGREYDIYFSAPEAEWDTYRPVFDKVTEGAITAGS
ncbi:serine/threonine-protein kinase [Streptomyces piniterrae]|uniref:serine/threonine-protein kinase n=1 Tax=Streptomyces piniterrae TaxID=2571125 RepID=UPI0016528770|nr:serine/threonine-protein kinase [Streptomyces piniterrae]